MGRSRRMKNLLMILVLSSSEVALAGSVAGTGGSTEVTQILNNAQLVQQTDEMYTQTMKLSAQLQKQSAMVDDMKRQGKTLSNQDWGHTSEDLRELSDVVRRGEAVAYSSSNTDAVYRQKFPGYEYYSKEKGKSASTFSDRYSDWSQTNMDSISGAMRAANLQTSQFQSEDTTMKSIERLSQTAQGRMEAVQAGNLIAAQQVGQMQKLRSLIMAQMQMNASFMSTQASERDQAKAKSEQFLGEDISHVRIDDGQHF
ncbi:MAG: P-type conjugative transfer protein TrbJ [Proteobacteria bacterium]|nr:MAG: P-type conjugative transfer protein TrbJ [Pseudomonadota bacterium]